MLLLWCILFLGGISHGRKRETGRLGRWLQLHEPPVLPRRRRCFLDARRRIEEAEAARESGRKGEARGRQAPGAHEPPVLVSNARDPDAVHGVFLFSVQARSDVRLMLMNISCDFRLYCFMSSFLYHLTGRLSVFHVPPE